MPFAGIIPQIGRVDPTKAGCRDTGCRVALLGCQSICGIRIRHLRPVERIEEFGAKLDGQTFFDGEGPADADLLDGPGAERSGERERYEGGFRGGQRNGYGQYTDAEGKMRPGRWADGKLVEPTP